MTSPNVSQVSRMTNPPTKPNHILRNEYGYAMAKLCLDCGTEIPDNRKRCWSCSYQAHNKRSAERSRLKRLASRAMAGDREDVG